MNALVSLGKGVRTSPLDKYVRVLGNPGYEHRVAILSIIMLARIPEYITKMFVLDAVPVDSTPKDQKYHIFGINSS